jgi:uncharacterized iron-regulated protein
MSKKEGNLLRMGLKKWIDWKTYVFLLLLSFIITSMAYAEHPTIHKDPHTYVLQKLKSNDIVFLGTTHKRKPLLEFISELLPLLHETGATHLGVEIASDQQERIDKFIVTGEGLGSIKIHPQIDCPDYRSLLASIHSIGRDKRPAVIALDKPYGVTVSRDEYMAGSIIKILDQFPRAKILAVVGNLHILKKVIWEEHVKNPHGFIRSYLDRLIPEYRIVSIAQCIDESPKECDFTRKFSKREGAVAMNCDRSFAGWKLGIISPLAIKPLEPYELIDGVIVY